MYSSSYSQARLGLEPKKLKKSKEKSCGYYMRIIFFFSSLIQSLIIVSLVLFLVYGQAEQSPDEKRIKDLMQTCDKLRTENLALQQQEGTLRKDLNLTLTTKAKDNMELLKLRSMANMSYYTLQTLGKKLALCEQEIASIHRNNVRPCSGPTFFQSNVKTLQERIRHLEDLVTLVNNNFTQMVQQLTTKLAEVTKERNEQRLAVISLNRDKASLETQLQIYTKKCKEDFVSSLQGINTVTNAFLDKIKTFFSNTVFHISCTTQQIYLEQIRRNCTSLSSDVETKFQQYLNQVGTTVAEIQGKSSKLMVENKNLGEELLWCSRNSSAAATESNRRMQELQQKHDKETEQLLKDQKEMYNSKELLDQQVKVKDREITFLLQQINLLNTTLAQCIPKLSPPKPPVFPPVPLPGVPKPGNPLFNIPAQVTKVPVVPDEHAEIKSHLKELQKYTNVASEVSG